MSREATSTYFTNLVTQGYVLLPQVKDCEIDEFINYLNKSGFSLTRDVIITSKKTHTNMKAVEGDFWFHTDGSFLSEPPRLIAIVVLEADAGGTLQLLRGDALALPSTHTTYKYGSPSQYVETSIITVIGTTNMYRYRKDYMTPFPKEAEEVIQCAVAQHTIHIGELSAGQMLVIDNWSFLHRRMAILGDRTIRRLWFAGDFNLSNLQISA